MQLIPYLHLSVSLFTTYCIITNNYLFSVTYFIGIVIFIDYLLHYFKIKNLRLDIQIHHLFALFIICFIFNHRNYLHESNEEISDLIKKFLSLEISTIFLTGNYLLPKKTILYKLNQFGFIIIFAYYRIYQYTRYVILSEKVYFIIVILSNHPISKYSMLIGINGLGILNFYWFNIILQKTFHKYACIERPNANRCNNP
jgi:hypothetical protein